ncbi:MAG: 3-methyl-2-oxobutanoate hydroxymethyltransferase [Paenibacillaceae bacterium]|nr:3-methyl-2-oxobutanoate hydroxymethyltransferase [Paenibacillaceae bacterium]
MEKQAKPVTTAKFQKMKKEGTPISVITAYDYPSAKLAEEAGVDAILVGDSLGNVVLGHESTLPVTLDDIIYHTRAVTRAVTIPLVVADMPFMSYHGSRDETLRGVARLMREGLAKTIKMEGGAEIAETVQNCVQAGVPVMGHLGFTPQSVHRIGGYFIQGKTEKDARKLIDDAIALEQAGAYAIVLELMPEELAGEISRRLSIPTIGIGAGSQCDGQVLVFHDMLQYGSGIPPKKFVKPYARIGDMMREGIAQYVKEVKNRSFPDEAHSFHAEQTAVGALYGSEGAAK